jgi:hypothetical protein
MTYAQFAAMLAAFNILPGGSSNIPGEAGFQEITTATDTSLTNPLKAFYSITTTAPGVKIQLPAMNLGNSLTPGEGITLTNQGDEEYQIVNVNSVTVTLVPPGALVRLTRTNDGTAAGVFVVNKFGSIAQQQADDVNIKGAVQVNDDAVEDLDAVPLQQLVEGLNTKQPINAVLSELALLTETPLGLMVQNGGFEFVKRLVQSLSDIITVTNADGVDGNIQLDVDQSQIELTISQIVSLADTLTALADELDTKLSLNGGTMLGNIELVGDATTGLQPVTFQQFQAMVAGLKYKNSCRTATSSALTATYNNGSSGVGATLTFVGAIPDISGVTLTIGTDQRLVVKNQVNPLENGIYFKSASNVLTRATDYDNPAEVVAGSFTNITEGDLAGQFFFQQTTGTITIGTTDLVFGLLAVINAGPGTVLTGPNTIGLPDLLAGAFASNDGSKTFNVAINARGMVTAITAIAINIAISQVSGLQTALDAKLPLAGGTMLGAITLAADAAAAMQPTTLQQLNSAVSTLNSAISTLTTAVNARLPLAGGTLTGNLTLPDLIATGDITNDALTASQIVITDSNKKLRTQSNTVTGNLVLIQAQQAANNVLDFILDAGTLSAYRKLILEYDGVQPLINNTLLQILLSTNGGSSFLTTNYRSGLWVRQYNTNVVSNSNITTAFQISGNYTSTASDSGSGCVEMYGINTFNPRFIGRANLVSGGNTFYEEFAGNIQTSGVNAFRLNMSGSNLIANGRFALYGVPI